MAFDPGKFEQLSVKGALHNPAHMVSFAQQPHNFGQRLILDEVLVVLQQWQKNKLGLLRGLGTNVHGPRVDMRQADDMAKATLA